MGERGGSGGHLHSALYFFEASTTIFLEVWLTGRHRHNDTAVVHSLSVLHIRYSAFILYLSPSNISSAISSTGSAQAGNDTMPSIIHTRMRGIN